MDQAVDTNSEPGIGGREGGAEVRARSRDSRGGRTGGGHESFGKQEGTSSVALNGIVVGCPVGGLLPGFAPGIATREPAIEARKITQREELPVVKVGRVERSWASARSNAPGSAALNLDETTISGRKNPMRRTGGPGSGRVRTGML
jgi:hypothetical protein